MEEPLYFRSAGHVLFGVLHKPTAVGANAGVVFCNAFAEERAVAHHVMTEFARRLASCSFPSLRFDYRGCGESEGEFEEATVTSRLTDIHRAVEVLCEQSGVERAVLLGLRFGAVLAVLAARQHERVEGVVMWEPVVNPQNYALQLLRQQAFMENSLLGKLTTADDLARRLEQGESVDVLAYPLSTACYREIAGINLSKAASELHKPALVVGISKRNRARRDWTALLEALEKGGGAVQTAQFQTSHFWIDPNDTYREGLTWFGHEPMFAETIHWIERVAAGNA